MSVISTSLVEREIGVSHRFRVFRNYPRTIVTRHKPIAGRANPNRFSESFNDLKQLSDGRNRLREFCSLSLGVVV